TFATSNITDVFQAGDVQVNRITFSSGADAFTITTRATRTFTISGTGVTNNSGTVQNFQAVTAVDRGVINFTNSATAGTQTLFTNNGNANSGGSGGETVFANTSTASNAAFTNNAATAANAGGGSTQFFGNSRGGHAYFLNKRHSAADQQSGFTEFHDSSS